MAALSFRITRNDISPFLSGMATAAKRPEPVFRAMGTTFLSLTMGNFKSGDYRPRPWPSKKDGSAATLQKSGTLSRAFHLTVSNTGATVANPMVYAARHQFGDEDYGPGQQTGVVKFKNRFGQQLQAIRSGAHGMPARPYFPVEAGQLTRKAEEKIAAAGRRAIQLLFGI